MKTATPRPRLGFLGVGWIGKHRMEAIAAAGAGEVAAVADPDPETARRALEAAPGASLCGSLDDLLGLDLDGIVIATPSALHAAQATRCLEAGVPVFCQKPLGRNGAETRAVVEAARKADRLLGVDLSYRQLTGVRRIREWVEAGRIGEVYAVNLVFHNAYGPDKAWFYDPKLSGGGCLIDLGIHLVDLSLWTLGFPGILGASGRLLAGGSPLACCEDAVEDYAVGRLDLATGATVTLACSWRLPAGRDAVIEASFYGRRGGLSLRNVGGSFYDFRTEWYEGTRTEVLDEPPDAWGGRAAVEWAERLRRERRFDPESEHLVPVAEALDAMYRK